jgi:hypothetical protein
MVTTTNGQATQTQGPLADVREIRECRLAEANKLLAEGWELHGVHNWASLRRQRSRVSRDM